MSSRKEQRSAARVVREQLARERRRRRTLWTSLIAVAVLVIAGLVGWSVYAGHRPASYTPPPGASSDGSGVVVGNGPVTVDIYEDFICPICHQFEQQSGSTVDQLVAAGKVRVVYHPVAFLEPNSTTNYSTRSSAASGCAAQGGKFREYAKALFQHQPAEGGPGLPDSELINIGVGVGLNQASFSSCVQGGTYKAWTAHVTDAASAAGVNATPTVMVAGKQVSQPTPAAITAAVAAAGK
jgi:protein-disulfide isomerase